MAERRSTRILESELVGAYHVACRAPAREPEACELTGSPEIVVPLRGLFVYRTGGVERVADPGTAFVFGAAEEYSVAHPIDGGDDCVALIVRPDVVEEALGAGSRAGLLRPATQLAVRALMAVPADGLGGDETALALLAAIARDVGPGGAAPRVGPAQRRRAQRVRALVASDPTRPWSLAGLARREGCSPYHLARVFRAATGETIHGHVVRLRLALALERLAGGADDLAGLATDLGFAHHSHFTARFRAAFGITPTGARAMLRTADLAALRMLLAVPAATAA